MIIKFLALLIWLTMSNEKLLFDFTSTEEISQWRKVNDVVMGGISKSYLRYNEEGSATFAGVLSPDNNGGFASYRAQLGTNELEKYEGVSIRVKGDGNQYNLRFRTTNSFDGFSYQAKFRPKLNEWVEVEILFSEFEPIYRGRILSNKPSLESRNIKQIGILIADKQFGEFSLDIDWIKFIKLYKVL